VWVGRGRPAAGQLHAVDQARHNVSEVMATGIVSERVASLVMWVVHNSKQVSFGRDLSRRPRIGKVYQNSLLGILSSGIFWKHQRRYQRVCATPDCII
jgi:hypothetical protein